MEHITQANLCGCAIASLAMVTGDHYYGSRQFFRKRNYDKYGTSTREILSVFNFLGYKTKFISNEYFSKHGLASFYSGPLELDKLDKDAILIVKTTPNPIGPTHAVAWDSKKKRVRDPSVGLLMTRHYAKKWYSENCIGIIVVEN